MGTGRGVVFTLFTGGVFTIFTELSGTSLSWLSDSIFL